MQCFQSHLRSLLIFQLCSLLLRMTVNVLMLESERKRERASKTKWVKHQIGVHTDLKSTLLFWFENIIFVCSHFIYLNIDLMKYYLKKNMPSICFKVSFIVFFSRFDCGFHANCFLLSILLSTSKLLHFISARLIVRFVVLKWIKS